MNSVFHLKENKQYSLRNVYELYSRSPRTVKRYMNNPVFSAKNMVYSNSENRRKHFHMFLQNKNKKMETRLPLSALQEIFATCWFSLKYIFISLANHHVKRPIQSLIKNLGWTFLRIQVTARARGLFLREAPPSMFDWVLNTLLTLLNLLSLSSICERAYSNLARRLGWRFL